MQKAKKVILQIWDLIDDFVLEAGRLALIGAYGAVLPYVLNQLEIMREGDSAILAGVLFLILKSLDRYLHEKGIAQKGIARF